MANEFKKLFYFLMSFILAGKAYALDQAINFNFDSVWNAFWNIFKLITKTLTGGNADVTYGITVVIFFVLLFAIILQLIRSIHLFSQTNTKLQNTIAFALSALSTLGIFWYSKLQGKTVADILSGILKPFGIWAGIIIGGVMALITYRGIEESEIFTDDTGNPRKGAILGVSVALGWLFFATIMASPNIMWIGYLILIISIIIAVAGRGMFNWVKTNANRDVRDIALDLKGRKMETQLLKYLINLEDLLKKSPGLFTPEIHTLGNKIKLYVDALLRLDSTEVTKENNYIVAKEFAIAKRMEMDVNKMIQLIESKDQKNLNEISRIVTTLISQTKLELTLEGKELRGTRLH